MDLGEYYNMIQNTPMIKLQNQGLVMDQSGGTQSGLALNMGPVYNKQQQQQGGGITPPNTFHADGTKVQSNFVNLKNQQQVNQQRKY